MESSPTLAESQRVLAAIVMTDAVSFSARMSVDEEGTLSLIQRDLKLIADFCDRYGGQVLKSTGDGLLMSFVSAVQAVNCAQAIQAQLTELSAGLSPGDYLQHRIGIHLGDVLFSHADVLGNGVNIAARLQTQSMPGGICISQTVHDVVKAQVGFKATYLGPLRLKNIKEPVPAYQIPPVDESATAIAAQAMSTELAAAADPLDAVVQLLQQDTNSHRIKKLIFGTCHNVWENDPAALAAFDLKDLVQTLRHRYPTPVALEMAFNDVVARLNRQAEYIVVASHALAAIRPLYAWQTVASQGPDDSDDTSGESLYLKIAIKLQQSEQILRIRKLLYGVTTGSWENNPAVLEQQALDVMVATTHQMAPTPKELNYHLQRVIRRLNRQTRYARIAEVIVEAFQPLYSQAAEATALMAAAADDGTALAEEPAATPTTFAEDDLASIPDGPATIAAATDSEIAYADATAAEDVPAPRAQPVPATTTAIRDRDNLYPLRLEIMRYANPLRTKILLLSTLRSPFTFSHPDWLMLKDKTLDDLLRQTFEYCPTYGDLESKLTIIAHCLDDTEENIRTTGAILQAMKPYYPPAPPSA